MQKSLLRRSVAYMIDSFIACAFLLLIVPFMFLAIATAPEGGQVPQEGIVVMLVGILLAFAGFYGYFLLRDGLKKGSFGKRIMGLTVVHQQTGEPCSFGRSFIRNLLLMILQGIDLIVPFVTTNGQRIGDMAAKTLVIQKQSAGQQGLDDAGPTPRHPGA